MLRFYPPVEMTGDAARGYAALHRKLEAVIRAVSGSVAVDSPAVENTPSNGYPIEVTLRSLALSFLCGIYRSRDATSHTCPSGD